MKNKMVNRKSIHVLLGLGILLGVVFALPACTFLGGLSGDVPEGVARATWTPEIHPTDLPYQMEAESISYFGETPAVVIFGSQDPDDDSPLQAVNLSTDDVYDVSVLTPGPISTWSRPIMSEDKELFFQIGPKLYKLLPGGSAAAIDLPFDVEDPVFCNWSWQGQIVCLNALMTEGYLVDRDLNLVEMSLPAYTPADDTVAFYSPYRSGENAMRILQTETRRAGGQLVVSYKELDLETLSITSQQIRFDFNFNRRVFPYANNMVYVESNIYDQSDEDLTVIGITDDADRAILQSILEQRDDAGNLTDSMVFIELFDLQADGPASLGDLPKNIAYLEKSFYQNHAITKWFYFERENRMVLWPGVYDLETGELVFDSADVFDNSEMYTEILPYGDDWLVGCYYGLGFVNNEGHFLKTEYFPDEIVEAYGDVGLYAVTQPMEP